MNVEEALAQYREHGWARLGTILDEAQLENLRRRSDDLMLGRISYPGLFFQLDTESGNYDDLVRNKGYQGPSLRYRKLEKLEKDPLFWAFINQPLFAKIAREIIGDKVSIYRCVLMNKPSEGGTNLPFHQDGGGLWGLDKDPELQIWTALDDAGENGGCLEVVDGSHKWGLAGPLGGVIRDHVVAEKRGEELVHKIPARAGEAILIHNYLWHRSGRSDSGHPRRAISVCYMDASTRCLRKRGEPRQFQRVFV